MNAFPQRSLPRKKPKAPGVGALALALVFGQAQAVQAKDVAATPVKSQTVIAGYWTVGPYYTYAAAYNAACILAANGYYTQIVFQYGFYYVVYS